jgi:hypothetical protein
VFIKEESVLKMIPLYIYKIGVPIGLFVYYLYRLFRIYILKSNMEFKFPQLYGLFLGLGIPVSLFLIVQTFFISDLVDYLSLLYVNMGILVIVEIIATFKLKSSKSYSNAKVFRYYLYFITAILLWMIFN